MKPYHQRAIECFVFGLTLIGCAILGFGSRQDLLPGEVVNAWEKLAGSRPSNGVTSSTQHGARGQVIWDETIKVSERIMLIEIRTMNGVQRPQVYVRGPIHKFVIDRSAGGQNVVEIVDQTQSLSDDREGMFKRAQTLLAAPFAIYGTPFTEFFAKCQLISVTKPEPALLRIEFSSPADGSLNYKKNCTNVRSIADFDGNRDWRLIRLEESFTNSDNVHNHINTLMHYDPVDPWKYEIEVTNADTGALAWRTSVQPLPERPTPEEFTVEHYGIVVHPESSSAWWRRPSVWIGILAVVLLSTAAWLRRTKSG